MWLLSTTEGQELQLLLGQVQTNSMTNHRLDRGFSLPRNEKKLGKGFEDHIFILFKGLNMMQYVTFMDLTPGPSGQSLSQQ